MENVKIKVLKARVSTRDTIVGKIYDGVFLETGDAQPDTGLLCDKPMLAFSDEVGDMVHTYASSGLVEVVEGEE